MLQIALIFCFTILYTHVFACGLWWNLQDQEIWMTPVETGFFNGRIYIMDQVSQATDSYQQQFDQFLFQYFSMWYYSNLSFALADICPRTPYQIVFCLVLAFLNLYVYTFILTAFFEMMENLNSSSNMYQEEKHTLMRDGEMFGLSQNLTQSLLLFLE